MAHELNGLRGVQQDLAAGKSLTLPTPDDYAQVFAKHRARQSATDRHRDPVGDRLHDSVARSFERGHEDSILKRMGWVW